MRLFDINGPFMEALRKLSDIIIYNLLFVIFSLPIVTAGASFAALCDGMQQLAEKELIENGVIKTFFSSLKKYFKEGTKLWGCILLIVLVMFAAIRSGDYMPQELADFYVLTASVISIICSFGFQFAYPLLVKKGESWRSTIKTSFLMGLVQFPWAICSLGVTAGFCYITLFMRENAFYYGIFYWVAAGFGVLVYINSFFFLKAYKKVYKE